MRTTVESLGEKDPLKWEFEESAKPDFKVVFIEVCK